MNESEYKELLRKYILYMQETLETGESKVEFSKEEWKELEILSSVYEKDELMS